MSTGPFPSILYYKVKGGKKKYNLKNIPFGSLEPRKSSGGLGHKGERTFDSSTTSSRLRRASLGETKNIGEGEKKKKFSYW